MTRRNVFRFLGLAIAMIFIEWDPWLRFRDIDFHEGQHLAWMQHLAAGRMPGRDLCLSYGPLYTWSMFGFMRLTSWSVVGLRWYFWAAQSLGLLLGWRLLCHTCRNMGFAIAGLVAFVVFTPAFQHWYGFTNVLRQTLALTAMLAALQAVSRPDQPIAAWAAGVGLGVAIGYSPEAGLSALVATLIAGVASSTSRQPRGTPIAWLRLCAGCVAVVALTLAAGSSGSLTERIGGLVETSRQFLDGFLALPYLGGALGRVIPGVLLASTAAWIAARIAAEPLEGAGARHLGLLAFGWAAFRAMLGRTDPPHVREAMPVVILLVTMHLEAGWFGIAAMPRSRMRSTWMTAWALAAVAVMGLTALKVRDAMTGGAEFVGRPTVLRSKSPAAFRIASDMQRAGLRRWVDLPRIGGLWLSPAQADQVLWMTGELTRRTRRADPIYAAPGAEACYFLADRVAANRFPVSMHGIRPFDQARIALSLGMCRAVVTDSTLIDDRPWGWWLPVVEKESGSAFRPVGSRGSLTLSIRK